MRLGLLVSKPHEDGDNANDCQNEKEGVSGILLDVKHLIMPPPARASRGATALFMVFVVWIAAHAAGHVLGISGPCLSSGSIPAEMVRASCDADKKGRNGDQSSHGKVQYSLKF